MPSPSRRTLLVSSAAALVVPGGLALAAPVARRSEPGSLPDSFPTQDPDDVRGIVGKSHTNLDAVVAIVKKRPSLARASWDWGYGDWETALGAASHMGRRDIADVLMRHGARPNIFTYAMLGNIDVVRAICEASPGIQSTPGPHGISLMSHARRGQEAASSVVAYLEELGGADPKTDSLAFSVDESGPFVGEYEPLGAQDTIFKVRFNDRQGVLTLGRDDRQYAFLRRHEPHVFTPIASPSVRIEFEVRDDMARALTIRDGDLVIAARRVGG